MSQDYHTDRVVSCADGEPERERRRVWRHAKLREPPTNTAAGQCALQSCCRDADDQSEKHWVHVTHNDLTRTRSVTAGPHRRVNCGALRFTLNYHLSTLNFLSTPASGWLHRLVRPIQDTFQTLATRDSFGPTGARLMSTHLLAG